MSTPERRPQVRSNEHDGDWFQSSLDTYQQKIMKFVILILITTLTGLRHGFGHVFLFTLLIVSSQQQLFLDLLCRRQAGCRATTEPVPHWVPHPWQFPVDWIWTDKEGCVILPDRKTPAKERKEFSRI